QRRSPAGDDRGEVAGEGDRARVALLAILRQPGEDAAVPRRRDRGVVGGRPAGPLAHVLVRDPDRGEAGARPPARAHPAPHGGGGCGSSRTCWYAIETGVSPVNGGRPVSISNITQAAE